MNPTDLDDLLADLKHDDLAVRDRATRLLWHYWFHQKGRYGLALLQRAQDLIDAQNYDAAEQLLSELIAGQPDFAEARNRRAVLRYLQHRYQESLQDCRQVVNLVPYHFGALHGIGLCYIGLENYRAAVHAFHRVLAIQPHATINQVLLLECTARL